MENQTVQEDRTSIAQSGDHRKECCRNPDNLLPHVEPGIAGRQDIVVKKCKVCGCRHFEVTIDPIKLGLKGSLVK